MLAFAILALALAGCSGTENGTNATTSTTERTTPTQGPDPYAVVATCDGSKGASGPAYSASGLENLTDVESAEELSPEVRAQFFSEAATRIISFDALAYGTVWSKLKPSHIQNLWHFEFDGDRDGYFDQYRLVLNESAPSQVHVRQMSTGAIPAEVRNDAHRIANQTPELQDHYMMGMGWDVGWGACVILVLHEDPGPPWISTDPYWAVAIDLENENVLAYQQRYP